MKLEQALEIQAHADGQLALGRRAEVDRWLRENPVAASLRTELVTVRQAVREHEPDAIVPVTREFYWSQIQRRIAVEEAALNRAAKTGSISSWVRWLAPALGVAALALILTLKSGAAGGLADATVMTFRSDNDGLTIHWIN
jgi:hypothetical protein